MINWEKAQEVRLRHVRNGNGKCVVCADETWPCQTANLLDDYDAELHGYFNAVGWYKSLVLEYVKSKGNPGQYFMDRCQLVIERAHDDVDELEVKVYTGTGEKVFIAAAFVSAGAALGVVAALMGRLF